MIYRQMLKEVVALKSVSLEVKKGEVFGLIGPDGAGKSSLFRILTTLLLPSAGRAFVGGYDVVDRFREVRNIVGYMPVNFLCTKICRWKRTFVFLPGCLIPRCRQITGRLGYIRAVGIPSEPQGGCSVRRDETEVRVVLCADT